MAAGGAKILIRTLGYASAASAALALAGCGGTVGGRSARVAGASARAEEAGSSRFDITYEYDGMPDIPKPTLTGEMNYVTGVGDLRYEFRGKLIQQIVFDGKHTYIQMPTMAKYLGTSKEWITSDDEGGEPSLDIVSFLGGPSDVRDPGRVLEFLLGTSGDVRQVGTEDVRGVSTTRYRGEIEMERVIDRAPADQRADLREQLDSFAEDGFPKTIPFDAWIDDDGLARRVRLEVAQGETGGSEIIEFYDFGVDVDVRPPAPNEVLTDEEFATLLENHHGDDGCEDDSAARDRTDTIPTESGDIFSPSTECLVVVGQGEGPKAGDK